ncbi:hypothetical protein D3C77_31160 [compost metagenome]
MNNEEGLFQNQFGKMKIQTAEYHKGFFVGVHLQACYNDDEATARLTALTDTLTEVYNHLPEQLQDATDGLLAGLMEG